MLAIWVDRWLALVQEHVGTRSWPVAIALWLRKTSPEKWSPCGTDTLASGPAGCKSPISEMTGKAALARAEDSVSISYL